MILCVLATARRDSDGVLTIMVVNKTNQNQTDTVTLSNVTPAASAQVYRYSAANLNAIVRQSDQSVSGTNFTATFPAASITLLVLPAYPSATSYLLWTK